ncbi:MAG: FecR family protein [Odoribacter sp.]|nr:FecR family protein [Odoribacter sp.]
MAIDNEMRGIWIEKLLKGVATWEEQCKLAKSVEIETKMKSQWEFAEEEILDKSLEERIWRKIKRLSVHKKRTEISRIVWRTVVAACVVLALLVGPWWLTGNKSDNKGEEEFCTFFAEKSRSHILPDSSVVWMKAGSTIRYGKNFNVARAVWLSGESVFEVKKNAQCPFRVYVERAFVEVKGTVFNVATHESGHSEVTLYSGAVEFNTSSNGRKIKMKPGQRVVYSAENESIGLKDIQQIDWSQGRYRFKDILISDLFQVIHDIYHVEIDLAENVPLHYRFTGFIRYDEVLTDVFSKICFNTDLKLKKEADKYIIYK